MDGLSPRRGSRVRRNVVLRHRKTTSSALTLSCCSSVRLPSPWHSRPLACTASGSPSDLSSARASVSVLSASWCAVVAKPCMVHLWHGVGTLGAALDDKVIGELSARPCRGPACGGWLPMAAPPRRFIHQRARHSNTLEEQAE